MASSIEKVIASTFMEMAQGLESGQYGKRPKIALTGMGSEHGEENSMQAAVMAAKQGVDVYYICLLYTSHYKEAWMFGREAQRAAMMDKGWVVSDLYRKAQRNEQIEKEGTVYELSLIHI